MIFDKDKIEDLPEYGEVVNTKDVLEKVAAMLEKGHLAFVPDYTYGNKMHLDTAEDFLLEVRRFIKEKK